ncbi:MAG: hypothetical protein KF768_05845 [Phycisphaeraceae bacterium]|nr:hypothetical protein [Phycisphaeraceae bacterium]
MKPKPWQTVLIAVGLLVGGGLIVYSLSGRDAVEIPDAYFLVDVETGQVFRASLSSNRVPIPAEHPETGRVSLIGATKGDDGKFFVSRRDLIMLSNLDKSVTNSAVDASSGEIKLQPGRMIDYPRKR